MEFYRDRSCNKPDLVWSNLSAHHYGPDLKPLFINVSNEIDPNELKDKTLLTRYKLSNNMDQFSILFELLQNGFEEVWSLITVLRTNPEIYVSILTQDESFFKNLDSQNMFMQLYTLQIIEQLLNEYSVKRKNEIKGYFPTSDFPPLSSESSGPSSGSNNQGSNQMQNNQQQSMSVPAGNPNINVNSSANIPDAPPMGIGPMPPPNANNSVQHVRDKIFESLDSFLGAIELEDIDSDVFSEEEIQQIALNRQIQINNYEYSKQKWLPEFLQKGGLDLLISMLQKIVQQCQAKKGEDILKSKYQKELVNTLLMIIKRVTISTFCANSPN